MDSVETDLTEERRHMVAPRRLLSRVRDLMAAGGSAQARLDKLVSLIATSMVADVCSVYLLRAGEVLELFATQGLKPSAVHVTRLRLGEGLIGEIGAHARPLALSDAQNHARFAYRPETGEEVFHSFMGVPIVRERRVLGVLAVQNTTKRDYDEEDLETLQTVAMVLAELVAGGELVPRSEILPAVDGIGILPLRLEGTRLNAGISRGVAVLHEHRFVVRQLVADDVEEERVRLQGAVKEMHGALDAMLNRELLNGGEHRDILETYRMIAEDAGWLRRIDEAIATGLTAEAAVQRVREETQLRMAQVTDPYLRERVHDLDDLANRLMQYLTKGPVQSFDLPDKAVIIARAMGPADLLDYDTDKIAGLVLEQGSPTAHVAVIARALDIPVVGRVKNLFQQVTHLDSVIVDADSEQVFIRPSEDVTEAFDRAIEVRETRKIAYAALRDLPAETQDGVKIELSINAGLVADVKMIAEVGADGIGLYRTEVPFLARPTMPNVEEQIRLYTRILDEADGKPVTFRTLDAGGDKVLPYWNQEEEENPSMGWRAVRLTLDRPFILRQQIRAFVTAAAGRDLRVMFPMIAEVGEFEQARAYVDRELARLQRREGQAPESVKVGAMLEVPALLFQLPALLKRVDFLSVGTNDLMQFLFAADRSSPTMSRRYDLLSPPPLSALKEVIRQCDLAGVPVSVCGEVGGKPLEAMALIGVGLRRFSVPAPAVGPVKAMIRSLSVGEAESTLNRLLDEPRHSLREILRNFASDHGVVL
ncbi:MAG: phosphoenolpyruvate--protein phosphotransferase [Magnetospiraceae bacterium]